MDSMSNLEAVEQQQQKNTPSATPGTKEPGRMTVELMDFRAGARRLELELRDPHTKPELSTGSPTWI